MSSAEEDTPEKQVSTMAIQIREAIEGSGLSLLELSGRTGVDPGRLSRFMRGERTLTLPAVEQICDALGLELVQTREPTPPQSPGPGRPRKAAPQEAEQEKKPPRRRTKKK